VHHQLRQPLGMLLILCRTHTRGRRFPLAHVGATLGRAVIFTAAEMVDLRTQIRPHHRVAGTVCFGLGFGCELPGTTGEAGP
jgi:hypothetical protein